MKFREEHSGLIKVGIFILALLLLTITLNFYVRRYVYTNVLNANSSDSVIETSLGIPTGDDPVLGSKSATTKIIYFYDYQCG